MTGGNRGDVVVAYGTSQEKYEWQIDDDEATRMSPEAAVSASTLCSDYVKGEQLHVSLFCGSSSAPKYSLAISLEQLFSSNSLLQWFALDPKVSGAPHVDVNLYVEMPDVRHQLAVSTKRYVQEEKSVQDLSSIPSSSPQKYARQDRHRRKVITEEDLRSLIQEASIDDDGRIDIGATFASYDKEGSGRLSQSGIMDMMRDLGVGDILLEAELGDLLLSANFPCRRPRKILLRVL